eukprot:m.295780 g.295780  ORF g.295780 m.295780 type:complete len:423 (-) comp20048_c0_seq1:211-1479(-)
MAAENGTPEIVRTWEWFTEEPLPWYHVRPFRLQLEEQPTVLVGEIMFIALSVLAIVHAAIHGRQHMLMLVSCVLSGTVNDIFFMVMPFVDNFWHAQCTFMLTPRMPLYIPCVYIVFQYAGMAASWRLRLPLVAQSAAAALLSALLYSAYDIVGAKFLWWTWHDTDAATFNRWNGVPFGSTAWTLVHVFVFSLITHRLALTERTVSFMNGIVTLVITAVVTTPIMMMTMGVFQLPQTRGHIGADGMPVITVIPGKPDALMLALIIVTFVILAARGLLTFKGGNAPYDAWLKVVPEWDKSLYQGVVGHFVVMTAIMALGDPTTIVSTGIHQDYGDCNIQERDLCGYERNAYLCKESFDEDFTFDCPAAVGQTLPPTPTSWYTICGRAHTEYGLYVGTSSIICLVGIVLYGYALNRKSTGHAKAE